MVQIPVIPANVRPSPTKPVPAMNHGFTSTASAVKAMSRTPATIITCRTSGIGALALRTTGSPAFDQATMPPSMTLTSVRPEARSASATLPARFPERHRTSSCCPACCAGNPVTENTDVGKSDAPSTCSRRCSSTSRTSTMRALPALARCCASRGEMLVAVAVRGSGAVLMPVGVGTRPGGSRIFPARQLPFGDAPPSTPCRPQGRCHRHGARMRPHAARRGAADRP